MGPVHGIGQYGLCVGEFTYFPNGTSNPSVASCTGGLAQWVESITYSATGVQTIVFKTGFAFAQTPRFVISPVCAALADSFEATQIGAYNATTRTLVIQQRQDVTGYAAAAAAGCFVTVMVFASDSQGK
jgi:hypothetical protein